MPKCQLNPSSLGEAWCCPPPAFVAIHEGRMNKLHATATAAVHALSYTRSFSQYLADKIAEQSAVSRLWWHRLFCSSARWLSVMGIAKPVQSEQPMFGISAAWQESSLVLQGLAVRQRQLLISPSLAHRQVQGCGISDHDTSC